MIAGTSAASISAASIKGFWAQLEENSFTRGPIEFADSFTYASSVEAAQSLFSEKPRSTALFCANDMLAFGALGHFRHV